MNTPHRPIVIDLTDTTPRAPSTHLQSHASPVEYKQTDLVGRLDPCKVSECLSTTDEESLPDIDTLETYDENISIVNKRRKRVEMQVLDTRGESVSTHGRVEFAARGVSNNAVVMEEDEASIFRKTGASKDEKARLIQEKKRKREEEKLEKQREKERLKAERLAAKEEAVRQKQQEKLVASLNRTGSVSGVKHACSQLITYIHVYASGNYIHDNIALDFQSRLSSSLTALEYSVHVGGALSNTRIDGSQAYVYWERKVRAEFDEHQDMFIPCEERVEKERYIAVWMPAMTLIQIPSMEEYMAWIKLTWPNKRCVIIVEGLEDYYRLRKRWQERIHQHRVLSQTAHGSQRVPVRAASLHPEISDVVFERWSQDAIERIIVELQIVENALIVLSKDVEDSVEWLSRMSLDVANIPFKHTQKPAFTFDASAPTRSSSVSDRSIPNDLHGGANPATVSLFKMLQQLRQCTPMHAKAVCNVYPSLRLLYQEWAKCPTEKEAHDMLQNILVEQAAGTRQARRLGPALSKRIYQAFNTTDPNAPAP